MVSEEKTNKNMSRTFSTQRDSSHSYYLKKSDGRAFKKIGKSQEISFYHLDKFTNLKFKKLNKNKSQNHFSSN